ncbi:MAG TPA: hypothetical protein VKA76_01060 [Gammaproteobacteria bacterium]|nr:hypothetical protein [Gammaproteobacteria bacterium]
MLDRRNGKGRGITSVVPMEPNEPLWKRAPRQDENGKPFSDFMMVIPKLRLKPAHIIQDTVTRIEQVLESYSKHVVFADLNLKINVLWVIVRPVPGICFDLPCAINHHVPEALLVAQPTF